MTRAPLLCRQRRRGGWRLWAELQHSSNMTSHSRSRSQPHPSQRQTNLDWRLNRCDARQVKGRCYPPPRSPGDGGRTLEPAGGDVLDCSAATTRSCWLPLELRSSVIKSSRGSRLSLETCGNLLIYLLRASPRRRARWAADT